jgi:hypothetical protein
MSPLQKGTFTTQGIFLVLISVRGIVDPRAIVQLEVLCQWKTPVTPSGIKPVTFQLVAQSLKQLCHRVLQTVLYLLLNLSIQPLEPVRLSARKQASTYEAFAMMVVLSGETLLACACLNHAARTDSNSSCHEYFDYFCCLEKGCDSDVTSFTCFAVFYSCV